MKREFHTFDVFTDQRFAGNPLAIVTDGQGLDEEAMQAVAREFNLSETMFLFPPDNEAHSMKARIFTPGQELPFAGHPTVGAAVFLGMEKLGAVTHEEEAIIVLETGVGAIRAGVRLRPDEAPFAEFDVPRLPEAGGEAGTKETLAAALSLAPEEIGFENHLPAACSAGNPFIFVPVRNLDVIARARVDSRNWDAAFAEVTGAYLYTRETVNHAASFHARMFAPAVGVDEDPATGSAAAAFAAVVHRFDEPRDGIHGYRIEQGYEMGRPGEIMLEMEIEAGALVRVRIGGHAVPVARGELEV